MKSRIAILASGNGSTAESFIRATHDSLVSAEVVLVICNNPDAGIITRINNLNEEFGTAIETVIISSKTHPAKEREFSERGRQTAAEQQAFIDTIRAHDIDLVINMGYLKKNGPAVVDAFGWRSEYTDPAQAMMLNTHPGLLPESKGFYGIHVQEHVIDTGLSEAGHTLHIVGLDYDDGPVVAEDRIAVLPEDTPETLFDRVQVVEKEQLPGQIEAFIHARQKYLEGDK